MLSELINDLFARRQGDGKPDVVTGLVVQGGGMRGIYSMAALSALEECGLGNAFDHVFGSSAGAINAAYLLAEQAKQAVTVYLDDISNRKFVNFFRVRRIVDIDYLVDDVLKRRKALNVRKVMAARSTLHIILTDVASSEALEVTNRDNSLDLMEALRATAAMPILYNKSVTVGATRCIDGGLRDAVPLLRAIKQGCTDIVVVLTREPAFRRQRPHPVLRVLEGPFLRRYSPATRELILAEDTEFNRTMEVLLRPGLAGFSGRLAVVYPSDMSRMVERTTSNRSKLMACALLARDDMRTMLGLISAEDNPWAESADVVGSGSGAEHDGFSTSNGQS